MSDSSNNDSWIAKHNVPAILHNPERHQQRLQRRAMRKSLKKQRASRSRVRSSTPNHRKRHTRRNHSRNHSRTIHPSNIPNTVTNWDNFDSENYNDVRKGPPKITVEKQLHYTIIHTEGATASKVCSHINAILDKIAHRPKGEEYYPKNKLTVSAVEDAIMHAIRNNTGDHHKPMSIAILDTLLTHPLFKNVQIRSFDSNTRTYITRPYDTINEALLQAVRNTNDMRIIRYLVKDRGANPAANHFAALLYALLHDISRIRSGRSAEKNDIIEYFMQHPSMQKWETLHQAIEYINMKGYPADNKLYYISFFVAHMFPLLEDKSDKKTKERIIFMHDHYREYMNEDDYDEINKLYSIITQSFNKALPANIHNILSRYG